MNRTIDMGRNASRNRLLATVSGMALIASICAGGPARAEGQPTLWFELGWDMENLQDSAHDLAFPVGPIIPQLGLTAPLSGNLALARSYTDEGKVTFQPDNSDWVFSASIRYGRSQGKKITKQALPALPTKTFISYHYTFHSGSHISGRVRQKPVHGAYPTLNTELDNSESHFIIDFAAGKDVGLGLFGRGSTSTFSAGVRFAQFTTSRKVPDFHESPGNIHFQSSHQTVMRYIGYYHGYVPVVRTVRREFWNEISGSAGTSQNFSGIGPSIKWDASAQVLGNSDGGLSLDWGANAALLYGKQKKKIHFQSSNAYHCLGPFCPAHSPLYTSSGEASTSKGITVPNVGGFAGISLKYQDVKVSLGYRADLFVNAIDVGFATHKSSNLCLHGPFASLSIGVGD